MYRYYEKTGKLSPNVKKLANVFEKRDKNAAASSYPKPKQSDDTATNNTTSVINKIKIPKLFTSPPTSTPNPPTSQNVTIVTPGTADQNKNNDGEDLYEVQPPTKTS